MIVDQPGTAIHYGTGHLKHYKMGFFHFPNNNLAIRKDCARDLGMYDPRAIKSEDVDICFRIARDSRWVALREKGNFVRHKARKNFGAFVRQMWGWGRYSGRPYAKTGIRGIYLYWLDSKDHKIKFDIEIERFPLLVCIFLSDFHIVHLLTGSAIIAALFGKVLAAVIALLLCIPFGWRYTHDDRRCGLSRWKTLQLAGIHYVANVAFVVATVTGAFRYGIVLVPSSIFRARGPDGG
jgi:hypothetical protein